MQGDMGCTVPLSIEAVSRIHFTGGSYLGTSRANPIRDPRHLETIASTLRELGIDSLITIGGDDTVFSAMRLAATVGGQMQVVHVFAADYLAIGWRDLVPTVIGGTAGPGRDGTH
jgi:6-phosphofructokinase